MIEMNMDCTKYKPSSELSNIHFPDSYLTTACDQVDGDCVLFRSWITSERIISKAPFLFSLMISDSMALSKAASVLSVLTSANSLPGWASPASTIFWSQGENLKPKLQEPFLGKGSGRFGLSWPLTAFIRQAKSVLVHCCNKESLVFAEAKHHKPVSYGMCDENCISTLLEEKGDFLQLMSARILTNKRGRAFGTPACTD